MIVSKQPPPSGDYITFQAADDLQDTDYDIDSEVIEKGRLSRIKLLSGKTDENQPALSVQQQENQTSKQFSNIDKVNACLKVASDIRKANTMLQDAVTDKVYNRYQEMLRDAKWRKMKYKC